MGAKTITVTNDAYTALKSLKAKNESFSKTILRITRRKPLAYFYGILDKESGKRLEKAVMESRKLHSRLRHERIKKLDSGLK